MHSDAERLLNPKGLRNTLGLSLRNHIYTKPLNITY